MKVLGSLLKESESQFFMTFNYDDKEFQIHWDTIEEYPDINKEPTNFVLMREKLNKTEYF